MIDPPTTRMTLIRRLGNSQDQTAWAEFVDQYAPLLYRFARQKGLQDADASDVVQNVFQAVARHVDRFVPHPRHPSFRRWFFRIAHNKVCDHISRKRRDKTVDLDPQLLASELLAHQADNLTLMEIQRKRDLLLQAAETVKPAFKSSTWDAFWKTAIEGHSPEKTASELNLSTGAVYIARSRVMAKLREHVKTLECDKPT